MSSIIICLSSKCQNNVHSFIAHLYSPSRPPEVLSVYHTSVAHRSDYRDYVHSSEGYARTTTGPPDSLASGLDSCHYSFEEKGEKSHSNLKKKKAKPPWCTLMEGRWRPREIP